MVHASLVDNRHWDTPCHNRQMACRALLQGPRRVALLQGPRRVIQGPRRVAWPLGKALLASLAAVAALETLAATLT